MWWANDNFPIFIGIGYFICTSHFGKTHATNDEYNDTGNIFNCCLRFILMPMTVTCTIVWMNMNKENINRFVWQRLRFYEFTWLVQLNMCYFGFGPIRMGNVWDPIYHRSNLQRYLWQLVSNGTFDTCVRLCALCVEYCMVSFSIHSANKRRKKQKSFRNWINTQLKLNGTYIWKYCIDTQKTEILYHILIFLANGCMCKEFS